MNLSDIDARNVRGVNSIFSKVFYSTGGWTLNVVVLYRSEKTPKNVAELKKVTDMAEISM